MSDNRSDLFRVLEYYADRFDVTKNPWPFCYRFAFIRISFAVGAWFGIMQVWNWQHGISEVTADYLWIGFVIWAIPYVGSLPVTMTVCAVLLIGLVTGMFRGDPLIDCSPYVEREAYCDSLPSKQSYLIDLTSKHQTIRV